ncbi:MAG: DSD1 family PLP-dependent enzyme [Chloroflexi bacterium]|nr:DSD1 family PLP-dependent enzyme [Chloroflexota bacterium]
MVWPPDPRAIGLPIEALDTPCLLLDLDAVERNLDRMDQALAGTSVRARPHTKTHKVPNIALMQLQRGAIGVCCAKLGEAEVMAAGGVSPILVTTEIVGDAKIRRLLGVAQQTEIITVVDDAKAAGRLSEALASGGLRLRCLIDVNVGQERTGVEPGEPALALAEQVSRLPGLELVGLQGYEGHLQHVRSEEERREANASAMQLLSQTAELLSERGFSIEIVSTAGTGTFRFAMEWPRVTEIQPGSYVVMDSDYGTVQGVGFENALTVLASVVSTQRRGAAVVDSGYKALSSDSGMPRPKALDAGFTFMGDEHGKLLFEAGNPLRSGDKVELIPSHCDTTINLHDVYYVTRGGRVVAVWPIAARGRIQ